jgi:hypothetical protein
LGAKRSEILGTGYVWHGSLLAADTESTAFRVVLLITLPL